MITSKNLFKRLCATVLFPNIGVKRLCATVDLLEVGVFC